MRSLKPPEVQAETIERSIELRKIFLLIKAADLPMKLSTYEK